MTQFHVISSFPRRRESSNYKEAAKQTKPTDIPASRGDRYGWVPACAGMTE